MFRPRLESLESKRLLTINPVLLGDLRPQVSETSVADNSSNIEEFFEYNGEVFFRARNGESGAELWKTNGTPDGTFMVKDINTVGENGSFPRRFTEANGLLFFIADFGAGANLRQQLWQTDGTPAGTLLVRELDLDSNAEFRPANDGLVGALGNELFFSAGNSADPTHYNLWKTNGTQAGTVLVKEFPKTAIDSHHGPNMFMKSIVFDGELYFDAGDGEHGIELWKTDGTSNGTEIVVDADPGPSGGYPVHPVEMNGSLYFFADVTDSTGDFWSSLFRTNGQANGTQRLTEDGTNVEWESKPVTHNGSLYFAAWTAAADGINPYLTDGTPAGTKSLGDIWKSNSSGGVANFIVALDQVFFASSDTAVGNETFATLWTTSGTPESTYRISDAPLANPLADVFVEVDGHLYFPAWTSTTTIFSPNGDFSAATLMRTGANTRERRDTPSRGSRLAKTLSREWSLMISY